MCKKWTMNRGTQQIRLTGFFTTLLLCCLVIGDASAKMTPIPVALSLGFSGYMKEYAQKGKNAAELAVKKIEQDGGIKIGGKKYTIALIYTDNKADPQKAVKTTLHNIAKEKVIAVVGSYISTVSIPMGGIANSHKTLMITPWASSNDITKNRKYVFRLSVGSDIQAKAITTFAKEEFKTQKAAILYDELSAFSKMTAKTFKVEFEKKYGKGSIVAKETFRDNKMDVKKQLTRIAATDAAFIFSPINSEQILKIVKQARLLGVKKTFVGGSWWNHEELAKKCGSACDGFNFVATFVPRGADGVAGEFVELYKNTYGELPTEEGMLTYDAIMMIAQSLSKLPALTGNIRKDRVLLRDKFVELKTFKTITGEFGFNKSGEPKRCAMLGEIKNGMIVKSKQVCP